jgi:hypothetical protein
MYCITRIGVLLTIFPINSYKPRASRRIIFQAVEKGQKLGQIAFISKNLSMSEGLIKV